MTLLCLPHEKFDELHLETSKCPAILRTEKYAINIDNKVKTRELRSGAWNIIPIGEDGEFEFREDELKDFTAWLMDDTEYRQSWAAFQALAVILYNSTEETLHFWLPGNSYLNMFFTKENEYYFSSRIHEISRLTHSSVNPPSESEFLLCYQFSPGTSTHFNNISKAGAGNIVDFNIRKQQVKIRPKKETCKIEKYSGSEALIIDQLYADFLIALDQQTSGFDRIGVLLGGFDSALIISGLKQLGREVKGYTFKYDCEKYNQTHIDEIIQRFRIDHEWIHIKEDDIIDGLKSYSQYYDQPTSQPHYLINTLKAVRVIAKDGIDLCLTGDGCDGVFFGYPTVYRKFRLLSRLNMVPGFFYYGLGILLKSPALEKLLGHPYRMARHITQALSRRPEILNFLTAAVIDSTTFKGLWNTGYNISSLDEIIYDYWKNSGEPDHIHAAYLGKNIVGLNKTKLSSCFNETGVTLKTPYLHPKISQYAEKLSPEHWIGNKDRKVVSGKYLIVKMAVEKSMLSENIAYQPKMSPVCSPVDQWLKTSLRQEVLQFLAARDKSINKSFLHSLLKEKTGEILYRKYATIDDYTSHVLGILVSYLSYKSS
ncbi:MAG: asparagine synthase C-terminal domain-containing protein [Pseudomonadota bacterium]